VNHFKTFAFLTVFYEYEACVESVFQTAITSVLVVPKHYDSRRGRRL
jgi:hypothetical protein